MILCHVLWKRNNIFKTQMNCAFPREMYYLDPEDKMTHLFLETAKLMWQQKQLFLLLFGMCWKAQCFTVLHSRSKGSYNRQRKKIFLERSSSAQLFWQVGQDQVQEHSFSSCVGDICMKGIHIILYKNYFLKSFDASKMSLALECAVGKRPIRLTVFTCHKSNWI